MTEAVGFLAGRLPVAVMLVWLACAKLTSHRADRWIPHWLPIRSPSTLVHTAAVAETATAGVVALAPVQLALPVLVAVVGALSAYGIGSVRRTGKCGCSADTQQSHSQAGRAMVRLLRQNVLLVAAGVAGITLCPQVDGAVMEKTQLAVSAGPFVVWAFLLLAGTSRQRQA